MGFLDIVKERRSIREFKDKEVSENELYTILEAGRWAPSGKNNQPWFFDLITEKKEIEELADLTKYSSTVIDSSALVLVFLDKDESYDRTKDLQAIGAACQNMLLMAHSLDLGGVWNGEILNNREVVEEKFGESDHELMAMLCIGYPVEKERDSNRKSLEEISSL